MAQIGGKPSGFDRPSPRRDRTKPTQHLVLLSIHSTWTLASAALPIHSIDPYLVPLPICATRGQH